MHPAKWLLSILLFLFLACKTSKHIPMSNSRTITTPFESKKNYSATYKEIVDFYTKLNDASDIIQVNEFGKTDIGKPLHEVIISTSKIFDPEAIKKSGKQILFINNGIHPGEPCGIDASMLLARDILNGKIKNSLLSETVVVIIPVYNVGGCLNRTSTSRANQNGPEAYGFRGNAQNLDLNRDFIKCDSKNAETFNLLFNKWNPTVFIDNHTSNGADYQYTMTLIATQKDKLTKALGDYLEKEMLPDLYKKMKKKKWEMTPYVYARETPDEGIAGFLDLPRYSSGYGALHNVISFMPETHMLKPYEDRVWSTYAFMESMIQHISDHGTAIVKAKNKALSQNQKAEQLDINWTMDRSKSEQISFKGYEAKYKESKVTGHSRLYYDTGKKYQKDIPFYNHYKPATTIKTPQQYVIPQAYANVISRLKWNNVEMEIIKKDTVFSGDTYYITDYTSSARPYEGHFLHREVEVENFKLKQQFYKGDVIVKTDQSRRRYIVETLEPQGPDSFFAWNFFDGILMQKEYYSAYVFEDLAVEILKKNKKLKKAFQEKKKEDSTFAEDSRAQLDYIYKNSPYYEKTFQRYPVLRVF